VNNKLQQLTIHTCTGCGQHLAIVYDLPLNGGAFIGNIQRVGACPTCGTPIVKSHTAQEMRVHRAKWLSEDNWRA
jgi:predicted RNA-binding Zn-ribbon protein involved in translation (DUF1610 family)